MIEDEFQKEVLNRFDQLSFLIEMQNNMLGYLISEKEKDTKEKIWLLNTFGFQPKDNAKILQTSQNAVNVRLSEKRKELKSS